MKKAVVLVVDDDPGARSGIMEFLGLRFDCDFKEAGDGEEAVQFVKSNHCDIMFLDVKLPKKNGAVVLKEAKEIDPEIDVIVTTAYSGDEVADDSLKRSASEYLTKPMKMEVLAQKFGNILKKRGQKITKT